jgi:hypothetical protein
MLTTPAAEERTPCKSSAPRDWIVSPMETSELRRGESSTITDGKRSVRKLRN